jgi:RHS repeat-associated protein
MAEPNGLYYMRARYYDPSVGRFISEDPLGFAGGDVNLSAYVLNNPVNRIDPSGQTTMVMTPEGPLPIYIPNAPPQFSPEQSYQMQQDLSSLANLFNPVPLIDWSWQQISNVCQMSKGKKDPRLNAPGMPGWVNPLDQSSPGDPNWNETPPDYDKWPWYRKLMWRLGRAASGGS